LYNEIFEETWRTFDQVAHVYRRKPWSIVYKVLEDSIELFGDIGSGPGHNALAILEALKSSRGVVVDISFNMVHQAMQRAYRRGFSWRLLAIEADMTNLPFRDNVFDLLTYIASIHHLPSKKLRIKALEEAYRVLRNKGKLLITVWARYQLYFIPRIVSNLIKKLIGRRHSIGDIFIPWIHKGVKLRRYYYLYTLKELRKDLEKTGFKILDLGVFYPVKKYFKPTKNYYAVSLKSG